MRTTYDLDGQYRGRDPAAAAQFDRFDRGSFGNRFFDAEHLYNFPQGGSVYLTSVNTYNARNQVTRARQYQGAEGSGTYQETTMSYDGRRPVEDEAPAGTHQIAFDPQPRETIDDRGR